MQPIPIEINKQIPVEGVFALDQIHPLGDKVLGQFNTDEKQELESFTNLRRQREYATSRLLLKMMAKDYLGISEFAVLKDDLGQPYGTSESQKYYVSIAHSSEKVFCGISEHEAIGIDLEPVDREPSERLRRRILYPGEAEHLADVETIRLWTIKEAFIKLRGKGLRLNMNEVCVDKYREQFTVEINNDKRAKICSFRMENNWLAIAYYQQ